MDKNDKCLKCKYLDKTDMPNLFCDLTCKLINDGDFVYCPKDTESVVDYVELLEEKVELLEQQITTKNSQTKKLESEVLDLARQLDKYENVRLENDYEQLAIQELEKVKKGLKYAIKMVSIKEHEYPQKAVLWNDICLKINEQIKKLKE